MPGTVREAVQEIPVPGYERLSRRLVVVGSDDGVERWILAEMFHDAPEGVVVNADVRVQKQNQVPMSVAGADIAATRRTLALVQNHHARTIACGNGFGIVRGPIIHHQTLEWLGTGSREGVETLLEHLRRVVHCDDHGHFRLVKHGSL